MEVREDRAEKCMNCKHLYIKDFATGICELKGEIILPDDSCPKFESSADKTNSLKDGVKEIDRQQAEIERLVERIAEVSKTIKSEAVKEFAERLKEKSYKTIRNYGLTKDVVEVCDIDNLVIEMVGENNA